MQPAREEIEELKERIRRLEQQQTEPIQVTVERRYPDRELIQEVLRKQDEQFHHLRGELESISRRQNEYDKGLLSHSRSINALQNDMAGARADILAIKATQSDHGELLKEQRQRLDRIESTQAEQGNRMDTMDGKLDRILALLQQKPSE